jgi:hypothetical protein
MVHGVMADGMFLEELVVVLFKSQLRGLWFGHIFLKLNRGGVPHSKPRRFKTEIIRDIEPIAADWP